MGKGKKKGWFNYVKRFFVPESKLKSEERSKKKIWFLEMFKFKKCAAIEAPEPTLDEVTEDHRKRAVAVAVATAAAAEAAVAAANAAAEVVRLTNVPYEIERRKQLLAAVRIQCVFRGHLGRKALSALKGIVKIQALVRGELARKYVFKHLALISSSLKLKPQARKERVVTLLDYLNNGERRHSLSHMDGIQSEELKCSSGRSWDLTTVSEGALDTFYQRQHEARAKRERMKQYSYSHRERRSEQSLQEALGRETVKSSRFDRHFDPKVHQNDEKESPGHLSHSRTIAAGHISSLAQLRTTSSRKHDMIEELNSSFSMPRRSFSNMKQRSIGDDRSLPNSPVFPAYMASTESAKAKTRSMSMPKQRLRICDTYSGHNSPHKLNLSTWSFFNNCDMTNSGKRNSVSQQTG